MQRGENLLVPRRPLSAAQLVEGSAEGHGRLFAEAMRLVLFRRVAEPEHGSGIGDGHVGTAVPDVLQDDVTGQDKRQRWVEGKGSMGERWIARTEDLEGWTPHPELGLEGGGYVDLGQDSESLFDERPSNG